MRDYITKKEALKVFKKHYAPAILKQYGPNDKPAMRCAWNDYVDALVKEQIAGPRANSWGNPY